MDHFNSMFNTRGNQLEETFKQKLHILDDLKTKINTLNLDFDRKHRTLTGQVKKLSIITDELESTHKNTTVGSLTGAAVGAAGGIASIVGLALAPVTLGVSLGLTAVGGVVGVAGGATGAIYNNRNNNTKKRLRENIEKITSDFQNTINAMFENVSTIINSTEYIEQLAQQEMYYYIPARMIQAGVDKVKGISAILGFPKAEIPPKNQGSKQFHKAVCWTKDTVVKGFQFCSGAVKKISSASKATKTARLSSEVGKNTRLSAGAVKMVRVSALTAKAARSAAAVSGVISALFVVVEVVCIVQNSMKLSEMNQSADKRNAKNIKSNTLKFIHQLRETAAHFQKTLDEIKDARDNAIEEFNKELKNYTSFLLRQKRRVSCNGLISMSIILISIVLVYRLI